jgi:hypothetical protein
MKNLISATFFVTLGASSAMAQGNFQLLVPFEEGLELEFYGFNDARERIFSETS